MTATPRAPSPGTSAEPPTSTGLPPVLVGVIGTLLAVGLVFPALRSAEWNPTLLVAFGIDAPESLEYAERLIGEVDPRSGLGHDGKFFFAQAIDPWLTDSETLDTVLDLPTYRAQRMMYPMLAGIFGLASPMVVIWMLVIVNAVAFGVGTWATSLVARGMGASTLWGLAFALNLGVWSELLVSGAGAVALAAAMGAVAALQRGNVVVAAAALGVAALSREVMLLCAIGAALWLWRRNARRQAAVTLMVPSLLTLGWALYVRSRLGWTTGTEEIAGIGWPFQGLVASFVAWLDRPLDLAVGLLLVVLLVVFAVRAIGLDWLVGWMALGFVPLAFLLTEAVWTNFFDISRAVAPVITSFLLVSFAGNRLSVDEWVAEGLA